MSNVLYFPNLRAAGDRPTATGTVVTDASTVDKTCLDVFARNDAVNPLYVSTSAGTVVETRFHDCSSTQINGSAGAFVEIETAAALTHTITQMMVNCTFGEPIRIRKAATALAAASASDIALLNQGQSATFDVSLSSGDKLWVKSASTTAVTTGYLTLNLKGV